jgi:hypothetical protein
MTSDVSAARPATSRTIGAAAALAIVAFVAYLPALTTGFSADDFFILSRLKAHGGLAHPLAYFGFGFFQYYRPIAFLSHGVDWQIWGLNPFGFHLTNLLLHVGCTLLVFQIGRRFVTVSTAVVAALLFALHPASHEAVYWIAARFDLMATFFTLAALWCLTHERAGWQAAGVTAFALALLAKESAISLLLIVPAWDVFVAKRDVRSVVRRLLPLVFVAVAYAILRNVGADLEAAGGSRRLPKLIGMAAILFTLLRLAWRRDRGTPPDLHVSWPVATGLAALMLVLLWWPVTAMSAAKAFGFAAYAAFYLISPIIVPSPPPEWFTPMAVRDALPGFVVVCGGLAMLAGYGRALNRHAGVAFLALLVIAALLPVSSMPGGLRYLYLASAGVSLLTGWLLQQASRGANRFAALAVVTIALVISTTQLLQAGRAWRAGSDMTRDGIMMMSSSLEPCGSKDVVLLTTPVGIGGVYANLYYEAFDVLANCSPKSFATLLRVVGTDAHINVVATSAGVIELRVPNYRGNIVASTDLSTFEIEVPTGLSRTVETAIGRLEISAEGATQVFRLTLAEDLRGAQRFYYSDGRICNFPTTVAKKNLRCVP